MKLPEHIRETLLNFFRKNVLPIKDRLRLINEEFEILPAIKVISAPGHTPFI
jgi:hypothetical protein